MLFVVLVVVWSLIFWGSGFFGHFRTARSGVYMVSRRTDSIIRFGFLVEWSDAHFSGLGLNPQLRLAARCRGGSRRRRELRKVWDWLFL